mgnify:CR=1 FL=1
MLSITYDRIKVRIIKFCTLIGVKLVLYIVNNYG